MEKDGDHSGGWRFAQCFGDKGEVEDITEGECFESNAETGHGGRMDVHVTEEARGGASRWKTSRLPLLRLQQGGRASCCVSWSEESGCVCRTIQVLDRTLAYWRGKACAVMSEGDAGCAIDR